MTSHADPTQRLAAADPIAYLRRQTDVDEPAPADVLGRILRMPPPRAPRRSPRPKRRLALAATAAAAVAIAGALTALPTGDKTSLVDRAYAWSPPAVGDDAVLYAQITSQTIIDAPHARNTRTVTRIWQRADRQHQFEDSVLVDDHGQPVPDSAPGRQRWHYEYDQTPDVRRTLLDGKVQTLRADDPGWKGRGRAQYADNLRPVVDRFRDAYEKAQLRDAGTTTFAGRPAHAYEVTGADHQGTTFYVDPDTAQPFGIALTRPGLRATVVVDRVERLPATPENLAKLDAPAIDAAAAKPRRR
jgi:hypothetical protein